MRSLPCPLFFRNFEEMEKDKKDLFVSWCMWRVVFANDLVTSLVCELEAEIRAVPELYRHTVKQRIKRLREMAGAYAAQEWRATTWRDPSNGDFIAEACDRFNEGVRRDADIFRVSMKQVLDDMGLRHTRVFADAECAKFIAGFSVEVYRHTNTLMHEKRQAMPQRYCLDGIHRELRALCAELSFRSGAPQGVSKDIPADSRTGRAFAALQKRMCDGRVYADAVNGACGTYKNAM